MTLHKWKLATRSQDDSYNNSACTICLEGGGDLITVEFKAIGRNRLAVAEKLDDKCFFIRLNTISKAYDAIANDVTYHSRNKWGALGRFGSNFPNF